LTRQCTNLSEDRLKGAKAEIEICDVLKNHGYDTIRLQYYSIDKAASIRNGEELIVLGDVFVISPTNELFVIEVKEKYPNKYGSYGLEEYRLNHYLSFERLTKIPVIYAIKDTQDNGKWYWNTFKDLLLMQPKQFPGDSWVDGNKEKVNIVYFKKIWFKSLIEKNLVNKSWHGYYNLHLYTLIANIKSLNGEEKFKEILKLIKNLLN